jgi:hypothetical protein
VNTGYGASSKSGREICLRVAHLRRGKTHQNASGVAEHRIGQVAAYSTVREILAETSTNAGSVL